MTGLLRYYLDSFDLRPDNNQMDMSQSELFGASRNPRSARIGGRYWRHARHGAGTTAWLERGVWPLLLLLALSACTDSSGIGTAQPPPTLVEVDPARFDDAISCGTGSGQLKSFVATLVDVTPRADDGQDESTSAPYPSLPSSPATDCRRIVSFGFVVPGRSYLAEIDGYEIFGADDLKAVSPGNRLQFGSGREIAVPRWRATCGGYPLDGALGRLGQRPAPVRAARSVPITLFNCAPFGEQGSIVIDIRDALPKGVACGDGIDDVAGFTATLSPLTVAPDAGTASPGGADGGPNDAGSPDASADAAAGDAAAPDAANSLFEHRADAAVPGSSASGSANCGELLTISGVAPGQYRLTISARSGGDAGARSWQTTCLAEVAAGQQAHALCARLESAP